MIIMHSFERIIVLLFLLINVCQRAITVSATTPVPIVLWHGMVRTYVSLTVHTSQLQSADEHFGDSCCFSFSLGQIKTILEDQIPGVYVKSIKIGENEIQDVENSYFMNVNKQIDQVCRELSNDTNLQSGYNAVGFSQGSQFLRAVAQRCPNPPILNLISLGGQHQGVYGLPNCGSLEHVVCDYLRRMLNYGAYYKFVQEKFVQAEYWHDPLQEDKYKKYSIFLADINNELTINETYKENLKKLKTLVLVKFANDTMVQPRESEWFGFYKPGQAVELETLQESKLYTEDRLGLQEMDKDGKIHFLSVNANHLQFTDVWFIENVIKKYLI